MSRQGSFRSRCRVDAPAVHRTLLQVCLRNSRGLTRLSLVDLKSTEDSSVITGVIVTK